MRLNRFRRFFRPSLKALSSGEPPTERRAGGLFGREILVLSRALCRFRYYAGDYRRSKALQALRLRVSYDSPFAETGMHIRPGANGAGVWTWDAAAVRDRLSGTRPHQILAESALHDAMASGARCVACIDGVEGQVWEEGELTHARWWPGEPDSESWKTFLRGARKPAGENAGTPEAVEAAWQDPPLFEEPAPAWLQKTAYRYAGLIAVFVLLAPISFEAARWGYALWAEDRYRSQVEEKRETARPYLAARRDGLAALDQAETHAAIGDERLLVRGLLDARFALEPFSVSIDRMQLSERDIRMYVAVSGEEQGAEMVQRLENRPSWSDVSLQPSSGGRVVIRGKLHPFAAPLEQSLSGQ